MTITLLHAGLAAGAALAALPVILHLFMKQKPKHIIFPALRLIRERQKRAKKQLKIKNWLLLAARMLLLILMALALAQPSINSESSVLGTGEVATALALVVDTSLSMDYTEQGKDRLAEAKVRAGEILKKATDDTEVFVIDSADPVKPAALTPASALKRIDGLTLRAANRPLNAALVQAHQIVGESKLARREVYVLTDLTASSWELTSSRTTEAIEKVAATKAGVKTYILRLTPKEVRNQAIVAAEPSTITPSEGESVEITATIRSTGPEIEKVAEFFLDGEKNKRDQKVVKLASNGEQTVSFMTTAKLEPGLHQGFIRLSGIPDAMKFDDVRYFTFHSQPASRILIVADSPIDAEFVEKALAPFSAGGDPNGAVGGDPTTPASAFKVDRRSRGQFSALAAGSLKEYSCIFLLNLDRLTTTDWNRLRGYVGDGGGLVVAPGDRADLTGYTGAAAEGVLPGKLEGDPGTKDKDTTFGKADLNHPLFSKYPRQIDSELAAVSIYHHWTVKPVEAARVLLKYTDGSPALVERIFKGAQTGRVLLWTTPLSRRVLRTSPGAWNEFPQSWAFLELMLESVPYLAGTAGERLNYEAGEDVSLVLDPAHRASNYSVQGPDPKLTERLSVPATSDSLAIAQPPKEGQWKVEGQAGDGTKLKLGFSINPPATESQVVALKPEALAGLFGDKDRYQVADDPAALERAQSKGRFGFELFPLVMFLILGLVTAENLLANKFHRDSAAA